ncbi:MAG: LytTR family transcriptional regulator DNA-binding domain-containing protein [Phaeodactylibacter sp.]|uniref:LytTR family transcriptional regulator DNA-binding domain-containing protein n=1 Tax=Phaeodactylibacter sp. TaxID=1940289 RepID=UPI0032EF040F
MLLLCFLPGQGLAQRVDSATVKLTLPLPDTLPITTSLRVYTDPTLKLNENTVLEYPFESFPDRGKLYVKPGRNYWFKFSVQNLTTDSIRSLLWTTEASSADLFLIERGAARKVGQAGSICSYDQLSYPFSYHYLELKLPPREKQVYLLRIEEFLENQRLSDLYLVSPTALQSDQEIRIQKANNRQFYYLFFGLLTFFTVLSGTQYLINRNRAFLYYAFYLLACIGLNAKQIRWLFGQAPYSLLSEYRYIVVYGESILTYLMAIAYVVFIRQFLSLRTEAPVAHRWLGYSIGVCAGLILTDLLLRLYPGYAWSFTLFTYTRVLLFGLFYAVVLYLLTQFRKPLFRYIFTGSLLMMLPFTLVLLNHLGILPKDGEVLATPYYKVIQSGQWSIPMHTSRMGVLLEILCFYMGLSHLNRLYKQKSESLESILARQSATPAAAPLPPAQKAIFKIPNRSGFETVPVDDILYCQAASNMCVLHLENGRQKVVSRTLKDTLKELSSYGFMRIHRSHAVRLSAIQEFRHAGHTGQVILQDGTLLNVSRQHKATILAQIE